MRVLLVLVLAVVGGCGGRSTPGDGDADSDGDAEADADSDADADVDVHRDVAADTDADSDRGVDVEDDAASDAESPDDGVDCEPNPFTFPDEWRACTSDGECTAVTIMDHQCKHWRLGVSERFWSALADAAERCGWVSCGPGWKGTWFDVGSDDLLFVHAVTCDSGRCATRPLEGGPACAESDECEGEAECLDIVPSPCPTPCGSCGGTENTCRCACGECGDGGHCHCGFVFEWD